MKKLFLIRYTYKNQNVEHDTGHYEDVHYLAPDLVTALNDIYKTNEGFTVNILQFEEIFYKEAVKP